MAIAHITSLSATAGAASVTTSATNTTGANLLVMVGGQSGGGALTASDSKGNTWNGLTLKSTGGIDCKLFWSTPTSVGSSHTFTISASGAPLTAVGVSAFSGAKSSSPFDVENGATGSSNSLATGSVTPNEDNEVLVAACMSYDTSATPTIDLSFTKASHTNGSSLLSPAIGYLIQTTAAAKNPTWSWNNVIYDAVIATFKYQAAATTGGNFFLFM
jgi:hypothetical protein